MSRVIEELRTSRLSSSSTLDTSIAFFYCKHKDVSRNSFLAVARGLRSQLLDQNKHLIQYFYDKSSECGETSLHTKALAGELLRVALGSSKRTHIIIDGLDECDAEERRYVVEFPRNTVDGLPVADMDSIHCLFISQDDAEARKGLANIPSMNIRPFDTIQSFVAVWKDKIESKFGSLQGTRYDIAKIVTAKAQGRPAGSYFSCRCRITADHNPPRHVPIRQARHGESVRTDFNGKRCIRVGKLSDRPRSSVCSFLLFLYMSSDCNFNFAL